MCFYNDQKKKMAAESLVTDTNLCTLFITPTPAQGSIILGRRKQGRKREKYKLLSRPNRNTF